MVDTATTTLTEEQRQEIAWGITNMMVLAQFGIVPFDVDAATQELDRWSASKPADADEDEVEAFDNISTFVSRVKEHGFDKALEIDQAEYIAKMEALTAENGEDAVLTIEEVAADAETDE